MKLRSVVLTSLSLATLIASCSKVETIAPLESDVNSQQAVIDKVMSSAADSNKGVVEIKVEKKDDLVTLSTKSFDLFGYSPSKKLVRARVSKAQTEFLKENNFSFKNIVESNMGEKGLLPGYMSYADMKAKMEDLASKNPNLVSLSDIGDTWEKTQGQSPNNDVWCLTITNKNKKTLKPASLFIGGMHSRELAPPEIMFKLAQTLVSEYGKDPLITEIVDTRDVNIVPMVNVDGRIQVEKGNNWQRKNTHGKGVDLNRNFDSHWNYQGLDVPSSWVGDSANPSSETYSGTAPASEPEVQSIQNFYKTKKLNMVLDMHSYGEMFFWPVGYSEKDIPEAGLFRNMYNNSFKKIGYSGGTSMSLLYPTTGTTDDYAYVKHHALGLGMEVGRSFRPSYQEVESMWKDLKPNLLYLLKMSNTTLSK